MSLLLNPPDVQTRRGGDWRVPQRPKLRQKQLAKMKSAARNIPAWQFRVGICPRSRRYMGQVSEGVGVV